MDISVLAQMLFRAEIRRLVFIIGLLVSLLVVSQCLTFPFGKTLYFLSANYKGSSTIMIANAASLNNLKSTKVYAVEVVASNDSSPSNLENEVGFENEMDLEETDYELASEDGDRNLSNKLTFEKGVNLGSRFQAESDTSRYHLFTQANRIDETYEKDFEPTTSTRTSSSEARNQAGIVFREGIRNLSVESVRNVKQNVERQRENRKAELLRSNLEDLKNPGLFMRKRWEKNPTTISQMNSLLLQSPLSSHAMVWI